MDVGQEDLDRFEQMLVDIQGGYGREDYAALRKLTTPEAMSYLAEELGEIASGGKRNEVKDVKLLRAMCPKPGAKAMWNMQRWRCAIRPST
ncbi:hypothetical protein IB60_07615 [Brucella abortus LMN1]|nr:hypothetical protein IB60_07615 [Brucella abortus LMN1]KFJ52679.1 tim44-like domain protein [Brucella abortus 2308]KOC82341.1 hypothetical protein AK971_01625 [Brucella abortus]